MLLEELLMGTSFYNSAVIHDDDEVSVAYGGETVCYDDAGTPLHELVEGLLYGEFALGVECAGGFVKDEDGRIFEYGAGNTEALPLSAAEGNSAIAYVCVVTLRELGDEFVGMGDSGGTAHLLGGVAVATKSYVVCHGVVEEDAVL